MTVAEDRIRKCRNHAEECRAKAELTAHPRTKEAFIYAAKEWDQLGKEIAEIEQMRALWAKQRSSLDCEFLFPPLCARI